MPQRGTTTARIADTCQCTFPATARVYVRIYGYLLPQLLDIHTIDPNYRLGHSTAQSARAIPWHTFPPHPNASPPLVPLYSNPTSPRGTIPLSLYTAITTIPTTNMTVSQHPSANGPYNCADPHQHHHQHYSHAGKGARRAGDLILVLLAILCPPAVAHIKTGRRDLTLSIVLTLFGWAPGIFRTLSAIITLTCALLFLSFPFFCPALPCPE